MTWERRLTIFAVEEVAHRLSPRFVRFHQCLAFVSIHALFRCCVNVFGLAALRAAIGKAGFIRPQFELLRANSAHFDRKCHLTIMIPTHTLEPQETQICLRWPRICRRLSRPSLLRFPRVALFAAHGSTRISLQSCPGTRRSPAVHKLEPCIHQGHLDSRPNPSNAGGTMRINGLGRT